MNNTTNLAMAAIFIAAILVIAGTFVATMSTTTQSTAFAYQQNKKGADKRDGNGNNNGNTVTIQKCKQAATQSGFDNNQGQECENVICTHPGENATCVQEGAAAAPVNKTQPVTLTCEQCLTKFLSSVQIINLGEFVGPDLCARLSTPLSTETFQAILVRDVGVSETVAAQIIQCLLDAGVQFSIGHG
jgi:hypothetical protein